MDYKGPRTIIDFIKSNAYNKIVYEEDNKDGKSSDL